MRLICLLAGIAVAPALAFGQPITYSFSGGLDFVDDPEGLLESALGVSLTTNDNVAGEFTLETGLTPTGTDSIDGFNTNHFLPLGSATSHVMVGDDFLMGIDGPARPNGNSPVAIFINGDDRVSPDGEFAPDNWGFTQLLSLPATSQDSTLFLIFSLSDFDQSLLNDDSYFVNDSLEGWDSAFWGIGEVVGDPFEPTREVKRFLAGSFLTPDDVTIAVPEPAPLGLLLVGLVTLFLNRRRSTQVH